MNLVQVIDQSVTVVSQSLNRREIINEVSPIVPADTCVEVLQPLITALIENAAKYAVDEKIRVVAKRFSEIVLVQVRYNGALPQPSDFPDYNKLSANAERIGGCMYMTCCGLNHSTLSFTFHNARKILAA